jgi:DNA-binding CsgD family transcriptional regulator
MFDATAHAPAAPSPSTSFGAWLRDRTALLQGLLDAIGRPIAVLGPDRALVASSRGARAALHVCLIVRDGRVGGFAGAASDRFDVALTRALIGCSCDVAVLPNDADLPWRLSFAPLADATWLNSDFTQAAVLLTIDPPRGRGDLTALARLYRLTNAELRVLALLLHGRDTAEIATEMRIAMPTLRSHLKALFQKTRTRRQAELVRLAAQLGGM